MRAALRAAVGLLLVACMSGVDTFDERGRTPLMWAAQRGDTGLVRRLLASGADVNAAVPRRDARELIVEVAGLPDLPASDIEYTPLLYAARGGRADVVRILIDAGAEVGHSTRNGHTALGIALGRSNVAIVRQLTAAGARPDHRQFVQAVAKASPEMVKVLAQRGGDVNGITVANSQAGLPSMPVLVLATHRGDPAVVQALLQAGAKVNARDHNGWTALRWARDAQTRREAPRAAEIIAALEAAGARDDAGLKEEALFKAVEARDTTRVRQALRSGANPNARDRRSMTPIINAAHAGATNVVAVLASSGAHVNFVPGLFAPTPLTAAIENGSVETVRVLLSAGARPDQDDGKGWRPLFVATLRGHTAIVALLLADSAKADGQTLGIAARTGDTVAVRMLIDAGASPTGNVLLGAISGCQWRDNTELIRGLLTRGTRPKSVEEYKPMSRAARWCSAEALRLLVEHGGDPNERDWDGYTALMKAAGGGKLENVRVLVAAGARIDAIGAENTTVFISAVRHPEVRKELERLRDSIRTASR